MADKTRITEGSILWAVAEKFESVPHTRELGQMIRQALDHIDWRYRTHVSEGMSDLAYSGCHEAGLLSLVEDDERYASDEDAIIWLCESAPRVQMLADLAKLYEVESQRVVKQALARLEAE